MLVHLAADGMLPALRYERAAVLDGEVWRLATGHFVHADLRHLGWNVLGVLIVWGLFARDYTRAPVAGHPARFDRRDQPRVPAARARARVVRRIFRRAARVHGGRTRGVAARGARSADLAGHGAVRGQAGLGAHGGRAAVRRGQPLDPGRARGPYVRRDRRPAGRDSCCHVGGGPQPRRYNRPVARGRSQRGRIACRSHSCFRARARSRSACSQRSRPPSRSCRRRSRKRPRCWATTSGRSASRGRKPISAAPSARSRPCSPPAWRRWRAWLQHGGRASVGHGRAQPR